MAGIDRRRFLLVAAAVAGTGLAGGASAWGASARAPGEARAATYRALVRALRAAPDGRFRHADPRAAHRRYARWYAAQPRAIQAHADAVLDALTDAGRPAYVELATPRRDRATVAAAVALACIGCEPPPAADERPDIPTLMPA
jgi:hypothetical protein